MNGAPATTKTLTFPPPAATPQDTDLDAMLAEAAAPATPPVRAAKPDAHGIRKIRYSHDAMIDAILQNPWISQNDIAAMFGYTAAWVSLVIASDAFQAKLAERKEELIDPAIRATIEERFKGVVIQSLDVLSRKLENPNVDAEVAIRVMEGAAKALGYGAKSAPAVAVQTNFVVQVPTKDATPTAWAARVSPPNAAAILNEVHTETPSA